MFTNIWIDVLVSIVALAAAAALLAWLLVRRTNYSLHQAFWLGTNWAFNRLLWHTRVSGALPVSPQQGAVIVANHRSGIDPMLIQMASPNRLVHWMVAGEYWQYALMRTVFQALQSIPVNRRGIDTASTKQAIRLAQEGGLVGLFPEGRINTAGKELLIPGRSGAALIAIKARVPVIPVYIDGAPYDGSALGPFRMWARVRVSVGQPIDLSPYFDRENDRQTLGDLTLRFLKEIALLGGHPEFEPKLAGKKWNLDDDDDEAADADSATEPDAADNKPDPTAS